MVKRFATGWIWVLLLGIAPATAQLKLDGDNVEMRGNALVTVGYQGAYGNQSPSSHGMEVGLDGNFSGSYYNSNFLNFNVTPYFNQSRANSSYDSLSNASGVTGVANLFSGSHFPGSVSYNYAYNSTGTAGLSSLPNFTTVGKGQGFGINWSELIPYWPTLSVGFTEGSGSGNLYGTDQKTESNNHNLTLRSSYAWRGFNLNAFYNQLAQHSEFPIFLAGQDAISDSHDHNLGFGTSHTLPWKGQFFTNYNRSSFSNDYQSGTPQTNNSNETTDYQTSGVSFHPTQKFSFSGSESYTSNLSGYLAQNLTSGNSVPPLNLGSASHSFTGGGGASYQFTQSLTGSAMATYYNQHYFGATYTGTYLSGTMSYNKRLLNTFTFSASVVDFANGQGHNSLGFIGTANAFHRIGRWELSGVFSYQQNVQSALVTFTASSYNYSANLHRRFGGGVQWTAAFNGSHSGLTNQPNTANHGESYGTTLSYRRISAGALYANNGGNALFSAGGLLPLPPLPGQLNSNLVLFSGHSYAGSFSITPLRRLTLTGSYNRSFNNTLADLIASRNNTDLVYGQLHYRLRRIELLAGFSKITQGISASGTPPGSVTSYYGGVSRWFDFF